MQQPDKRNSDKLQADYSTLLIELEAEIIQMLKEPL